MRPDVRIVATGDLFLPRSHSKMARTPSKPCKVCKHKKGSHVYFAVMIPGGGFEPKSISFPCQERGCICFDFVEMTLEEKIKEFGPSPYIY
jgi:hypothetical protein